MAQYNLWGTNGFANSFESAQNSYYANGGKDENIRNSLCPIFINSTKKNGRVVFDEAELIRKLEKNGFIFNSSLSVFLEQSSHARTGFGMMSGVAEGAAESAIYEKSLFSLRSASNPSAEISTVRSLGVAKTVAGVVSKTLGVVSAYEHGSKAYEAFKKNGIGSATGWLNLAKTGVDVFFIFAKASNPFVFIGSILYTVADVSTADE